MLRCVTYEKQVMVALSSSARVRSSSASCGNCCAYDGSLAFALSSAFDARGQGGMACGMVRAAGAAGVAWRGEARRGVVWVWLEGFA